MTIRKTKETRNIKRRFGAVADILVRLWKKIFKHLTYWLVTKCQHSMFVIINQKASVLTNSDGHSLPSDYWQVNTKSVCQWTVKIFAMKMSAGLLGLIWPIISSHAHLTSPPTSPPGQISQWQSPTAPRGAESREEERGPDLEIW